MTALEMVSSAPSCHWRVSRAGGWGLLLLILTGCGETGPTIAPVTGRVFLDGEPVADAGVLFAPLSQGPAASGGTEADGSFRLETNGRDGAILGEHRVIISKSESIGVAAEEGDVSGALAPGWKIVHHIPARYADPQSSDLSAVVEDTTNEFDFQLTSAESSTQ